MAVDWTPTTIGSCAEQLAGFAFKSKYFGEGDEGVRLLRGDNIAPGMLRWDGVRTYPVEMVKSLGRYELRAGDVVVAMDRPWIDAGLKIARVLETDLPCMLVQRVTRLRGSEFVDGGFLWAVVRSGRFMAHLRAETTGTAVPHISGSQIASFAFGLPPIPEQRAIASVFQTFDDKIESNQRLSNSLGEINRLAFVTLVAATSERGQLGELADVVMGQSPPGASYSDDASSGPLMVQGMGGFGPRHPRRGQFTSAPTKLVGPGVTLMTVRAPVGAVNVANSDTVCGRGVAGIVSEYPAFIEYLIRWLEPRWGEHETGTIFASVNGTQIRAMPVPRPSREQMLLFERSAAPLVGFINGLGREVELLTAVRDALLPKLVSGQIRVPLSDDSAESLGAAVEAHERQEAMLR
jgi:type I restriction enzyme S subunit